MANFKFKKKYGQNFLKDEYSMTKIASSINPTENDLIIEIGPGAGSITKELKKFRAKLLAFEIDEETKKYLLPLEDDKTKIIYEDFLEIDIKKYTDSMKYDHLYIIGNLPYYITTAIIEHIIDSKVDHDSLTIMVQKEVADRFLSKPRHREYGYMTVLLNYHYDIEKIIDVDRKKFVPMPKVDSTVIKLISKKRENIDYDKFKRLLKDSFRFKRKTLNNNLSNYDKNVIEKVLYKKGYSLSNRAEELDLQTFIDITENI